MAVADPLPPIAIPLGKARADACRVKQKEQLDIDLLCSKLEAHRREQETLKRRQQKRDAIKSALFVPRSAARQFAATATPMKDDMEWAAIRWASKLEPKKAMGLDGVVRLNPKQAHAGLRTGMTENEVMAAALAMNNPNSVQVESRRRSRQDTAAQRSRQGSDDVHAESTNKYKPGDSVKRRCLQEHDRCANLSIPAHRQGRDEPNPMPYDIPVPNPGDRSSSQFVRPSLTSHDRPNWSQQSQSGDDFRSFLRLPLLTRKSRSGESDEGRRGSAGVQSLQTERLERDELRRPSDSLITDAIQRIKKEEKQRRRDSLMKAFFKRQ